MHGSIINLKRSINKRTRRILPNFTELHNNDILCAN
jgi:hypothetical protein